MSLRITIRFRTRYVRKNRTKSKERACNNQNEVHSKIKTFSTLTSLDNIVYVFYRVGVRLYISYFGLKLHDCIISKILCFLSPSFPVTRTQLFTRVYSVCEPPTTYYAYCGFAFPSKPKLVLVYCFTRIQCIHNVLLVIIY